MTLASLGSSFFLKATLRGMEQSLNKVVSLYTVSILPDRDADCLKIFTLLVFVRSKMLTVFSE